MTETELKKVHVKNLYKLLAKQLNELIAMERNKEDKLAIREKQQEIELIQRVLIEKTVKVPTGKK